MSGTITVESGRAKLLVPLAAPYNYIDLPARDYHEPEEDEDE